MADKMKAADCTHEVADCSPDEVVIPAWCKWEPCRIIKSNRDTCDVRIFANGEIVDCQLVSIRFVRPLVKVAKPVSTPKKRKYGWTASEVVHLKNVKRARLEALARGERASQPRAWIRNYLQTHSVQKSLKQVGRKLKELKTVVATNFLAEADSTPTPPKNKWTAEMDTAAYLYLTCIHVYILCG